ncbi:glycosyltransferase family 22 protein [Suhomyces tanzawaensis NRRL Y-17324]|uniref:Mannosyltransferase n=1 Tax=Suhomyces tanzawaensis NRRL Y-17324 TaxID=984487 RepID=A0A1E4SM38_9ASCO|nr:glycosyltransferase family 22 protein [Suhomyces tanzawaensis NRRL Y-17324]ODV80594.1 glycosyltransferase family 22 protein [Suhomyces tanzawaensis NRRL Y-17324]
MLKYNVYLDAALLAVIGYHLSIAPFTKVEESFNIQAIHDILNYGVFPQEAILDNYDHINFPGVVPRSFEGSLILAGAAKYINWLTKLVGYNLLHERTQENLAGLVRGLLGLFNAYGLIRIRNSVNKINVRGKGQTKGTIGFWYLVLLLSQFHLLFYSSRTLPNFIALPGVLLGLSKILEGDTTGLTWLAFIGIIFRLEVGVFAVIIAFVSSLIYGQSNLILNVIFLAVGTLLGGFLSFAIDSYFWNQKLLPELSSFFFNIVDGKSAQWGVLPWSTYFNNYLWQLFRPPIILLLALPGLINDPASDETREKIATDDGKFLENQSPAKNSLRILFVSSLLYIAAMSFQPHKEWRFIVYVVPIFTLQAANGLAGITDKWSFSLSSKIFTLLTVFGIFVSAILSLLMGYVSSYNYPGGQALTFVNSFIDSTYANSSVVVHLDTASCMTGINRFGQIHDEYVTYDKTEGREELSNIWNDIQILVKENPIPEIGTSDGAVLVFEKKNWEIIHTVPTYRALQVGPIISLVRRLSDSDELFKFVFSVIEELKEGESKTLKNILRSLVVTQDYLYVYNRLAKDENLVIESGDMYKDQAQVGFEEGKTHEIEAEAIKEAVNAEIDHLEEN